MITCTKYNTCTCTIFTSKYIPYSRKVWYWRMFGHFTLFKHMVKKVWQMNRSTRGLLIVTTTLDGFSLVNCRQFAKFAKLSTRQTKQSIVHLLNFEFEKEVWSQKEVGNKQPCNSNQLEILNHVSIMHQFVTVSIQIYCNVILMCEC